MNTVAAYNLILAVTGLPIAGATAFFVSRMLVNADANRRARDIAKIEADRLRREQLRQRPATRPTYSPRAVDARRPRALSR